MFITHMKRRQDLPVLKGIHLTSGPGEMVPIIGPSSSGKSTLMNIMP
ncbi:ATP-binding cassette domain-containing protein [Enterobacter hormaechei]